MRRALFLPALWRWVPVWQRNFAVWYKLFKPAMLGNIVEPLLYLLALGYGLGSFMSSDMAGVPYLHYLASGMACASAMNTASFEGMYSAYTRMIMQGTWVGMMTTPLSLRDVVIGEIIWAGSKGLISTAAILLIATLMGLVADARALWVLPLAWIVGICFGAMAVVITAVAKNYDFFLYYVTLLITPMMLLSGVFFPVDGMPQLLQIGAKCLPLYHAIGLIRPLMLGQHNSDVILHLGVIGGYIALAVPLAIRLVGRRLLT
ncbi:MAG: ABC transporter permease [Gammaproteobacteria bacterium]|nr:ABC transporter permease [Gammaproteobacteria bacterium]